MCKYTLKSIFGTVTIVLAGFLFVANSAHAVLMLSLDDGLGNTGYAEDSNGDGIVKFDGAVGSWILNVTTGLTQPTILDLMDLNSINVSGGNGELTIKLTNTDYESSADMTRLLAGVGGVTNGSVSFQSYLNTTNDPFGMETLLHDTGILGGAFSSTGGGTFTTTSALYSLTTVATLSHSQIGQTTSFNYAIKAPEPSSLALFVIGLLGLGFTRRRRNS